jgi:hypothetical protein
VIGLQKKITVWLHAKQVLQDLHGPPSYEATTQFVSWKGKLVDDGDAHSQRESLRSGGAASRPCSHDNHISSFQCDPLSSKIVLSSRPSIVAKHYGISGLLCGLNDLELHVA